MGLVPCAGVDEGQRARDRDTVKRWAKAGGVGLEGEAKRAREKLRSVNRARSQIAEGGAGDDGRLGRPAYPVS